MKTSLYRNLQRKIILIVLVVSLAPLILLGGTIYYQFARMYKDKIEEQIRYRAKAQAEAVDLFLKERIALLSTAAHNQTFNEMTNEEELLFQDILDSIHDYFIDEVAKNRNMKKEDVEEIATGMFYTGFRAKQLGLVDVLGGKAEAIKIIENRLNITAEISEYQERRSFLEVLGGVINKNSFFVGEGIGTAVFREKPLGIYS